MIKTRAIICFLLLSLCACKEQKKEIKKEVSKEVSKEVKDDKIQPVTNDQLSDFIGQYEFKDEDNPDESFFLILKKVDIKSISDFEGYAWEEKNEKGEVVEKTLTGLFYGNTDLFDEVREGYTPGYFVTNVQVEPSGENSLKANIHLDPSDILENPVQPDIQSTKESIEEGNKQWQVTEMDISRELIFEIKNSNELILKAHLGLGDILLKKVK